MFYVLKYYQSLIKYLKMKQIILLFAFLSITTGFVIGKENQTEWGVSAVNIGIAGKGAVTFDKMLNDKNILSLNRFYRIVAGSQQL